MNIAILIPSLVGGGAERVAEIVGGYYSDKGHKVYYFLGNTRSRKRYDVKGIIVNTGIVNASGRIIDSLVSLAQSACIMRRYKKKYRINVAFSFMEEFNYINVLSRRSESVICSECAITSLRTDMTGLLYNKYMIWGLYNLADCIIVISSYSAKELSEVYHVKKKKMVKIPNPVILDKAAYTEKEWSYGGHTVICVGRYVEVKQQDIAIKAFSRVAERIEDAKLIICGEGSQKSHLEKLIKALNLQDKVYLLGFQSDITYYYEHAKVFLLTSDNEAFGNVVVEAMAAGLPVVSLNAPGGPPEILGCKKEKVNEAEYARYGIVTPHLRSNKGFKVTGQEKELGNVVAELLIDEKLWNHYSAMSKKRAQHYSHEKIMKKWDKLIGDETVQRG